MSKRINVMLPDETIGILDRLAPKGGRSQLIADAVLHYVKSRSKRNLADALKRGARANAQRDLEIANDWFTVEEEAWRRRESRKPTR